MWVVTLVCLTGLFYQCNANAVKTIKWSKSYSLNAVLTIPTANLTMPYQVWVNGNTYKSRVDYYGGVDKLYRQWNALDKTYDYFKIRPDIVTRKEVCNKLSSKTAETQTYVLNSLLPVKPWTYIRPEILKNVATHKFVYKYSKPIDENVIANVVYTIWVTFKNDGTSVPVRFVYEVKRGNSLLDLYCHDYSDFDNNEPDAQTLQMPLGMKCIPLGNAYFNDSIDLLAKYIDPTINDARKTIEKMEQNKNYRTTKKSFQWSTNTYNIKAVLTVPNAGISEPYQVWFDGESGKTRVDFYDGIDTLYRKYDKKTRIYNYNKVHSVMNMESKKLCSQIDNTDPDTTMNDFNSYLPDLPWEFDKFDLIDGVKAEKYVYIQPVHISIGRKKDYKSVYTISIEKLCKNSTGFVIPKRFNYELRDEKSTEDNKYVVLDQFSHDYLYFSDYIPDEVFEKPINMTCNLLDVESLHEPIDPLMEYIKPNLEHNRIKTAFDRFKKNYNKIYTDEDEHFKRMNIFKDNLRYINSHNRQHKSFTLGVNHLADLTNEETRVFLGTISKNDNAIEEGSGGFEEDDDEEYDINNIAGVNAKFDWRDYGAVSSVKDQTAMCAGCYAFTTTAAIESSAYVARGCKYLEELSEQAIIDCSWGVKHVGNFGCAGGTYEYALPWAQKYGLPLKSQYGPYLGMEGRCKLKEMDKLVKISSHKKLEKRKRDIKDTLRKNGPLLAAMDTNHQSFTYYSGGVYEEPLCSNDPKLRSHGVTIVGYGRDNGQEYWIIKNSFGSNWGENGYMRINMMRNQCGVRNDVYAVEFKTNNSTNCKPTFP